MDSFIVLPTIDTPTNQETGGGSGSTSYCVIAQRPVVDTPTNFETGGGGGSTSYCVIA
ncbi:hypothetical protein FA15DRAFT_669625 [Coprinopsis marcescibilis]|uniref:Uncharacterized protein n=1 Tax=Coprinopsis marcescibilis TaxID=230819 RepID=A0A5C3KVB3_COPMA|nr:hypothetical protein FA15DRAFT_669625 [Coprinopsis marcescibilis]